MKDHVDIPNAIGFVHIYAFLGISIMSFFYRKSGCKGRPPIIANIIKKMLFGTAYDGELLFLI